MPLMHRPFAILLAAVLAACSSADSTAPRPSTLETRADDGVETGAVVGRRVIVGIDESNTLVSFRPNAPQHLLSEVRITGLPAGERILGIDFRPADGTLVGIGGGSRLYRLDPVTGAATALGAGTFAPSLDGRMFGLDFNPTVDRVRLHSDAEQNLRLHPDLGTVAGIDTVLAYAAADANATVIPNIVATAYTNSALNGGIPPTSTALYALDQATRNLVLLPAPNGGVLRTVGALGVNFGRAAGFDVATNDNVAFASLNTGAGRTGLYRVDLGTGLATRLGDIGHREPIIGISVRP
jgi:hypothetical protein